ncbi:ATP-grasp domain-containing protein, partial [Pantoea ananatis]
STVLIQKRLRGQQFIVNAVSMDGMHLITEIWTDDKIPVSDASLICEKEILLPFRGEIQNTLVSYMKKALTLLGVDNGPSHSELIITEQGPVLIETAARMQGTIMHDAVISALGYSHVTLTAERYINPNAFLGKINDKYNLKKNLY